MFLKGKYCPECGCGLKLRNLFMQYSYCRDCNAVLCSYEERSWTIWHLVLMQATIILGERILDELNVTSLLLYSMLFAAFLALFITIARDCSKRKVRSVPKEEGVQLLRQSRKSIKLRLLIILILGVIGSAGLMLVRLSQ